MPGVAILIRAELLQNGNGGQCGCIRVWLSVQHRSVEACQVDAAEGICRGFPQRCRNRRQDVRSFAGIEALGDGL